MKSPKFSVSVVCLLVAAFGCSSPSSEKAQDPFANKRAADKKEDPVSRVSTARVIPMKTTKAQEKDVELVVEVPETAFPGKAIILKVSLTNKSKGDVFYGHISDCQDFRIQIQDEEDGKMVPQTKYGKIKLGGKEEKREKCVAVKLSPGGNLMRRYNLSQFFDLTIASTYNLSATIRLNDGVRGKTPFVVEVRNVKLRVLEPYEDPELAPLLYRADKEAVKP